MSERLSAADKDALVKAVCDAYRDAGPLEPSPVDVGLNVTREVERILAAHLADVEESARTAWAVHAEHVARANVDLLHQMALRDEALAHLADVEARLAAIEALHVREGAPNPAGGLSYFCAHCSSMVQDYVNWPCPTIRALHPDPSEPTRKDRDDMSETEVPKYHDGVLYGIRHPGPPQDGCTYCDSTLRQAEMLARWLASAPAGDSGGERGAAPPAADDAGRRGGMVETYEGDIR